MDEYITKKDAEKMVQDGINSYMNAKQFTLSKIPAHKHNGLDVQKIEENDLLPANQYFMNWVSTTSEVFTISKIPNFSLLTFYGVATNGAYGGGPYNEKATIAGEARVGKVFSIDTASGQDYYSSGNTISNFSQACTSAYTDVTSLSKQFVSSSAAYFAFVDSTGAGNTVASAKITAITETSIEITVAITSNWYIRGFLFLS